MRDLMVLGAMLLLVPLALSSPFRAFLLWGWTALVGINFYVFGFMKDVPFNLVFALIAITLILAGKDREVGRYELSRTTLLFVLFLLQATLSAIFAYPGLVRNWEIYGNLVKALAFCFFMPIVLTRRYRIHAFVIALVLGLSFHSLVEGLKTIAAGGGHHVRGIAKFGDNNHFAVALVMVVPLMLYLYQYSANRWARTASIGTLGLLVAAVIGTNSRGGLVALAAMGTWLVLAGRRKWMGLFTLVLGVAVVFALAPSSWWERMDTIKSADQDSSFMGRVIAWKISSAIALGNPLVGGGIHALENQAVWDSFRDSQGMLGFVTTPRPDTQFHAAHSIFFEVLGDLGILGFLIFLAILINVFVTRNEIRKLLAATGSHRLWISDLADALIASLVAYVIGGAAVSMAYYEVVYMTVMLMEILKHCAGNPDTDGVARVCSEK